jgi:hypothetical protein
MSMNAIRTTSPEVSLPIAANAQALRTRIRNGGSSGLCPAIWLGQSRSHESRAAAPRQHRLRAILSTQSPALLTDPIVIA